MIERKNLYIINDNSNDIFNFIYNKKTGIAYRIFKENQWSDYNIIVENCNENFHLALLPNGLIYLFYVDIKGNLLLKIYDNSNWSKELVLQKSKNNIYKMDFKIVTVDNEIHIIYMILNKNDNTQILSHQKIQEIDKISHIKIIDVLKFNSNNFFNIYANNNGNLYIVYQRFTNKYEIGYKVFNLKDNTYSDFNNIDKKTDYFSNFTFSFITESSIFSIENKSTENIYVNENLITELTDKLKKQEKRNLFQENKLCDIRESLNKFLDNKKLLFENIDFLQENLISKEEKITKLENLNMEINKKILNLNNEILDLKEELNKTNSPLKKILNNILKKFNENT